MIELRAERIQILGGGEVSAASNGSGDGGDVVLLADEVVLTGGTLSASGNGSGHAGAIRVTASDALTLESGALRTSAPHSAGGDIEVVVTRQVLLTDSAITAEAGGVTPTDAGGTSPSTPSS